MCGIIAVFSEGRSKVLSEILESYCLLESRGPDYGNFVVDNKSIIGFQRLCINDMSSKGNQPMESDNGVKLVCNGEIYNHKSLQKEFNIECKSSSDCEVLLKLYEKIGFEEMVKRIDGVFALVIIDGDMVYLARDRIGVRPLYQGWTENGDFAVASVAKALTLFCKDVKQIPPSIVSYNKNTKKFLHQEWSYMCKEIKDPISIIEKTLINAVKKRLMSDRPIGCLLSGGLDSSIVASILARLVGPINLRTYSIGMKGSTDLKYARKVAEYLGVNHTEVIFTAEEGIEAIPEVINAIESYDITTIRASVGMYLLSKYIKENTEDRVIFSGEGSDELLCGYLYFHFAPTPEELEQESLRLIKDLYLYDVLRADRSVSAHGLELRVPFLDKEFVDLATSLKGNQKKPTNGYEKYILRKSFSDQYLPDSVLWRRKEGFSDGVSGVKKSWYKYIQEYAETQISNEEFKNSEFISKEAMWYKKIYDQYYPTYNPKMYMWMPKWVDAKDPSGRVTGAYDEE